jgi:hypothetical protein
VHPLQGQTGHSPRVADLGCAQPGVRPGIVVKEKDVFHVSVRTNCTHALSKFVYSFLVRLVMCSEVEAGNFTTLVYSVLLNVGKFVLKTTETLWKNNLIIAKYVWVIHGNLLL